MIDYGSKEADYLRKLFDEIDFIGQKHIKYYGFYNMMQDILIAYSE